MSSIRNASSFLCLAFAVSLAACGSSDSGAGTPDDTGTPGDTSVLGDGTAADTAKADGAGSDGTATDTLTPPTDGSGTDTATSGDASGIACGAATCKTGEVCCVTPRDGGAADQVCAASCSDGGVTLACDGPEDCPSLSANVCCATLKVGGTIPSCTFESGAAACAATCPTKIPAGCPGEGKARLCHAKADCAGDTANPNCCTFSGGGGTATFCTSDTLKGFATICAP